MHWGRETELAPALAKSCLDQSLSLEWQKREQNSRQQDPVKLRHTQTDRQRQAELQVPREWQVPRELQVSRELQVPEEQVRRVLLEQQEVQVVQEQEQEQEQEGPQQEQEGPQRE